MPVLRIEKTKNYTVMSNFHLRDVRLSLKAKGLLSFMLSLPEDWDYSIRGLSRFSTDGIDSMRTALDELERFGYMQRSRERDQSGHLGSSVYTIYEEPRPDPPVLENPTQVKPMQADSAQDKPIQENPTQLSTEEPSTDLRNTEEQNKDGPRQAPPSEKKKERRHTFGTYDNVTLSDDDVEKLEQEFPDDLQDRIERLSEFMASTGRTYRSHLATIRAWGRRDMEEQKSARGGVPARSSAVAADYSYREGECL